MLAAANITSCGGNLGVIELWTNMNGDRVQGVAGLTEWLRRDHGIELAVHHAPKTNHHARYYM